MSVTCTVLKSQRQYDVFKVIVIQHDCTSDDQDARYVPTGTISTPQPGPNNPKPKPKPKPPKPTPRARSSLMSQGPKQPSKDIIKIPPQPAEKLPKELPEIQLLVDEARKLINNSEKNNSTKLIFTSVDFTAGLLDKKGGRLQLRYHGVTLDVPPGALEDVEMVYIYVQRSLEFSPIGEEGFASPLVHCGLSGLKFKTPVVLTFPVHLEDPSAWELKGIQQDSSGTPWKEISSESCQDSLVVFKERLCTMVVDHFTLFGVSARPKELRGASGGSDESHGWLPLRVGVFLPSDKTTMSGHLQLRVRIWDASQETRVKEDERHSKVIDTTCRLHLRTSEGYGSRQPDLDVSVDIQGLNDSWTSDPKEKIIPYEIFHLDPPVDESVTFNLRLQSQDSEGGLHPLLCDFVIRQRAHFNRATIVRAVVDIHDGGLRIETAHDSPNPMSTSGFHLLRDYLERERRWKLLADSSFGKTQGCTLDRWSCPSTAVLNAIFSRSVAQNPKATLGELYSKLSECGLPGAAEIVRREMKEWNLGVTGSEITQARGSQSRKSPEPKFPVQCSGEDSSLPRPICNAQQESLYEVLMPKKERERIAQARPSPTGNRVSRRGPEENDEEESRIHTLRSTNPPARAQPERIDQARPSPTGNRASCREPEENDEEESRIHTLRSTNPPARARAQPERIAQARPSSTGNRASRREPEENDEEIFAYADCLIKDQSGQLEENIFSIYQNAQVIPPSSSSSQLPRGYVQ
ncbi:uncharacterized protein LOC119724820 isoform X2 [Patiria miniata]|uniref:Netrin receptor UNC5 n=1 Tax=Patiria miniata TaxID=46514 RepID=A0A913ZJJ0_PATMI|nr:uncharacterized protein LOC119724820 isoform X2 [Patiria miniata]